MDSQLIQNEPVSRTVLLLKTNFVCPIVASNTDLVEGVRGGGGYTKRFRFPLRLW
jgi:hypothetical protein